MLKTVQLSIHDCNSNKYTNLKMISEEIQNNKRIDVKNEKYSVPESKGQRRLSIHGEAFMAVPYGAEQTIMKNVGRWITRQIHAVKAGMAKRKFIYIFWGRCMGDSGKGKEDKFNGDGIIFKSASFDL